MKHLFLSTILLLSFLLTFSTAQIYVTQQYTQAVDAAVKTLVSDLSFQSLMVNLTYTPVPICSDDYAYPSVNPIPSNKTIWNMCYQEAEYITYPWGYIYEAVGNGIVNNINSKYNLKLSAKFISINTTDGFFESLKAAVDSGKCDVVVADVTPSTERSTKVHFQGCNYGAVSDAYLRGPLDSANITVNRHTDLNRTGVIVAVYQGTTHEDFARANFQAATIRAVSYDDTFLLVAQGQAHAMIGNLLDVNAWLTNNPGACKGCLVKTYGAPSPFGSFTTAYFKSSGNTIVVNGLVLLMSMVVALLSFAM